MKGSRVPAIGAIEIFPKQSIPGYCPHSDTFFVLTVDELAPSTILLFPVNTQARESSPTILTSCFQDGKDCGQPLP